MVLEIARLGNPILRQKAKPLPVKQIASPKIQAFIRDLTETMLERDGVGLAAPQVGESLQIAAIACPNSNPRYPDAPEIELTVLINPKVRPLARRRVLDWEGCLSVENLRGQVPRWKSIEVRAYNAQGKLVRFKASDFFARVVQHECDHLQGRLFLDQVKDFSTLTHLEEFTRYWEHG